MPLVRLNFLLLLLLLTGSAEAAPARLAVTDIRLRWFVVGVIFWGLTCVQGAAQSFPSFSLLVHFTTWVVGHSHLAFVGDYTFWMFPLIYLLLPVVAGRKI